jgi:pimeloyl-ACP methyl ester carboxylesterase
MKRPRLAPILVVCLAPLAAAQEDRMVRVDGRAVHVRTRGHSEATRGWPTVVFESGAGTGLTTWSAVLEDVSTFAAVVAYDRAGIGQSNADDQPPTPRRMARQLRALLAATDARPPFVLVGHSWGGLLIRMFAAEYPADVTGLVYVDPTDPRSLEQNIAYLRASGYTDEGAREFLESRREQVAAFVRSRSGPYRAEMEVIQAAETSHFAEFRELPPLKGMPVSILVSNRLHPDVWQGRPCEPAVCHDQWMRQRVRALTLLGPQGPETEITLTDLSGHDIQREQPSLVVSAIRRVVAARPR